MVRLGVLREELEVGAGAEHGPYLVPEVRLFEVLLGRPGTALRRRRQGPAEHLRVAAVREIDARAGREAGHGFPQRHGLDLLQLAQPLKEPPEPAVPMDGLERPRPEAELLEVIGERQQASAARRMTPQAGKHLLDRTPGDAHAQLLDRRDDGQRLALVLRAVGPAELIEGESRGEEVQVVQRDDLDAAVVEGGCQILRPYPLGQPANVRVDAEEAAE